jgi:hypothetical protein
MEETSTRKAPAASRGSSLSRGADREEDQNL